MSRWPADDEDDPLYRTDPHIRPPPPEHDDSPTVPYRDSLLDEEVPEHLEAPPTPPPDITGPLRQRPTAQGNQLVIAHLSMQTEELQTIVEHVSRSAEADVDAVAVRKDLARWGKAAVVIWGATCGAGLVLLAVWVLASLVRG